MLRSVDKPTIGLLLSGGLDSCILLSHLLDQQHRVTPIYIDSGLAWQAEERQAVHRYLHAIRYLNAIRPGRPGRLGELVILELPLEDLYGNHWSVTGEQAPDETTPDEAVYLPGRNPLLIIKAALWCQMHGVETLALAPLGSNPFPDATDEFFATFEASLNMATRSALRIVRPFAQLEKRDVMELGRDQPLQHTFSCISPVRGRHCGHCNKCAERRAAFACIGTSDPTRYADVSPAVIHQRLFL